MSYNKNMGKELSIKNIILIDGVEYLKRFTIVNVRLEVYNIVKTYAYDHRMSMGKAVEELIILGAKHVIRSQGK